MLLSFRIEITMGTYTPHTCTHKKERNLAQNATLKAIKAAVAVAQNQLHHHEKIVR